LVKGNLAHHSGEMLSKYFGRAKLIRRSSAAKGRERYWLFPETFILRYARNDKLSSAGCDTEALQWIVTLHPTSF
jgi:hypothetical protein